MNPSPARRAEMPRIQVWQAGNALSRDSEQNPSPSHGQRLEKDGFGAPAGRPGPECLRPTCTVTVTGVTDHDSESPADSDSALAT